MKKIVVLFSGTGTNLENIINYFKYSDVTVIQTITNNPNANGIYISNTHNIPVNIIDSKSLSKDEYEKELIAFMQTLDYDLVVLAGYMKIVTKEFLLSLKSKVINIHPSLLPKYKGLNAIENSYASGDSECGVTVHYVNENVDDGAIILQQKFPSGNMSYERFVEHIKMTEFEILPKAIKKVLDI